jgi:aminocarboxymuconate-semialdehyde decarboxylase
MHKRVRAIPSIVDLDARFRIMDEFGDDYRQVLTLGSPPIEAFPAQATSDLARAANDGMAEIVSRHPQRFAGFVASLPMNDIDAAVAEAQRAIGELGALGVQMFTNINGRPLYAKQTLPLFDLMAGFDLPVWLHPARGADFADYPTTRASRRAITRSGGHSAGPTKRAWRWRTWCSAGSSTAIRRSRSSPITWAR